MLKKIVVIGSIIASLMLVGCSDSGDDSTPPPNTNVYDLRAINLLAPLSGLLEGGYSNGVTGSLFISRTDDGDDFVNGVAVSKIKSDTSITLSNGYTSQESSTSFIDNNGFTLSLVETATNCSLTSDTQIVPTAASIGTTSPTTAIYSCDDSTTRTVSWKLLDAGNGNAYYIFDAIISGAAQSKSTTTITITPENKVIYYKVYVDVIAADITGTFSGAIN